MEIIRSVLSGRSFVIDRFHISQTTDKLFDVYVHMLKSKEDVPLYDLPETHVRSVNLNME